MYFIQPIPSSRLIYLHPAIFLHSAVCSLQPVVCSLHPIVCSLTCNQAAILRSPHGCLQFDLQPGKTVYPFCSLHTIVCCLTFNQAAIFIHSAISTRLSAVWPSTRQLYLSILRSLQDCLQFDLQPDSYPTLVPYLFWSEKSPAAHNTVKIVTTPLIRQYS